jgi:serine protease Do
MSRLHDEQISQGDRAILRRLRWWIGALAAACLVVGTGVGVALSGLPSLAQTDTARAHAAESFTPPFVDIAKRVEPAVVNIDTKTAASEAAEDEEEGSAEKTPGDSLFDMFRQRSRRPAYGVGSGFIVDPKGYVLTNQHVVKDATRITVRLQSGEEYVGNVVGVDEETDLAVVKVTAPHDLPTVKLGDSSRVQVGDWVLAIGSPFGLDQTVTAGIISKLQRETPYFSSFQQFLQTDAAINRGNSGGPLVNLQGEVIGINSQIATSTGDYNGIGFALPSNDANFVYKQILADGRVRRGFLGLAPETVKEPFARIYGLPETRGAIVTDLRSSGKEPGPAAKAGLQVGDIIVEFNNQPVLTSQDLIMKVASTPVGTTTQLAYLREGANGKYERRATSVTLAERPVIRPDVPEEGGAEPKPAESLTLGLKLAELTPQLATANNLTGVRGLLIKELNPNGVVADIKDSAGQPAVRANDVIARINRTPVNTLAEFERVVTGLKPGAAVVLELLRYSRADERPVQRIVQFSYQ